MRRVLLLALFVLAQPLCAAEWFISPSGNNRNSGRTPNQPLQTFSRAFSRMAPGDTLILLDGLYTTQGTGLIVDGDAEAPGSAAPPSGRDRNHMTRVRARHPGGALLRASDGPALRLGTREHKRRNIHIQGLKLEGDVVLYNTQRIHLSELGIEGRLSIGTNDHYRGNDYNLIEDCWIHARDRRLTATNYRAHHNVWRRVVVGSDGCSVPGCNDNPGKADPSAGITIYDSHHVSLQNVIVLDRRLDRAIGYADFSSAQHTDVDAGFLPAGVDGHDFLLSDNEWLGCISAFSEDQALVLEADNVKPDSRIATIRDFVALFPGGEGAVAIANRPYNFDGSSRYRVERVSIHRRNDSPQAGLYASPELEQAVHIRSVLITGGKGVGIVAGGSVESVRMVGKGRLLGKYTRCDHDCRQGGRMPPWPLLPDERIPSDQGHREDRPGALIWWRVGGSGSFEDDPDSRAPSEQPLWPWPNETRIRREFCAHATPRRGWCKSQKSLTAYLWSAFGNTPPAFPAARTSR